MERRIDLPNIDLDECSAAVDARVSGWNEAGLQLSVPTWVDNETPWPRPLLIERAEVVSPMSFGFQLKRSDGGEAEVVVYAGGWADLVSWIPGTELENAYREIESPRHFASALDSFLARFIA